MPSLEKVGYTPPKDNDGFDDGLSALSASKARDEPNSAFDE
jgi:hypothetical protein